MSRYQKRARELKARIVLVGMQQNEIAEALGKSKSYVNQVLSGKFTSEPMLDKIERLLDQQEAVA